MSFPPMDRKTMSVFSAAAVSFFSITSSMPSQRSPPRLTNLVEPGTWRSPSQKFCSLLMYESPNKPNLAMLLYHMLVVVLIKFAKY